MPRKPTLTESPAAHNASASSHGYESRTHLDLFSGIGGFALAAKWNGLETVGLSEIDDYACKILKRHWPHVTNYGDIRNVRGVRADIVTGGFPCQPFSLAGKQRGAKDDRHLWPEMLRVVTESKPAWVLGENVPGIIGMELDRVLFDLEDCGYSVWPVVVPACAVDARHRRERVWIIAHANCGRTHFQHQREPECKSAANTGWDGPLRDVAHAESKQWKRSQRDGYEGRRTRLADGSETVEYPEGCGREGEPRKASRGKRFEEGKTKDGLEQSGETVGDSDERRLRRGRTPWSGRHPLQPSRWPVEPGMGRVVNGLPNRSHRLKGLGNAIVPQVAANFLHWMLEAEMTWIHNAGGMP